MLAFDKGHARSGSHSAQLCRDQALIAQQLKGPQGCVPADVIVARHPTLTVLADRFSSSLSIRSTPRVLEPGLIPAEPGLGQELEIVAQVMGVCLHRVRRMLCRVQERQELLSRPDRPPLVINRRPRLSVAIRHRQSLNPEPSPRHGHQR